MSIGNRVRNAAAVLFDKRAAVVEIGDISAYLKWLAENQGTTRAGVAVTESSAMTLSYVYSAMKVLSETVGHVPLELMRRESDGAKPATDHPLYYLLHSEPNPEATSIVFRETLEGHRNGWGNCYVWIRRRSFASDAVEELRILYPDRTRPRRLSDGSIVYETEFENQKLVLPAADVLHVPAMGFDGLVGYSPVQIQKETMALGLATQQFGNSFFGNGANPKMVYEASAPVTNAEDFRKQVDEKFSGPGNFNKTMILPRGIQAKPITINPDDAQYLETRKFNRTEVAGIYRVPPHLIGDLERSTFTNAVEMDLAFVKHAMVPIYTKYEQELNRKLLSRSERQTHYFKFNVNGILRGSPNQRADFYDKGIKAGWLKPNEARRREDLPEEPDGDILYRPINSEPADSLEGAEPVIEQLAWRISTAAVKSLERSGEDIDAAAEALTKHKDFVRAISDPLFKMFDADAEQFAQRHVDSVLSFMERSVADAIPRISPETVKSLLCEVLNERETRAN